MTHTMLSCPACGAQYNVALAAIPTTGRRVKCTACAYSWQAFAPENQLASQPENAPLADFADMAILAIAPEPELTTETDQQSAALLAQALSRQGLSLDDHGQPGKFASFCRGAVVALLTLVVLLGAGLLTLRQIAPNLDILQPAMAALGVPSPVLGAGLVFENVTAQRNADTNKLEISGQLRNQTAENVVVPSLQMAVFANVGDVVPLKTWVVPAKMPVLAAKTIAQLNYQLPDAPKEAAQIKLTFVE